MWPFKNKSTAEAEHGELYIEHFPLSGLYFPKHNDKYLEVCRLTGIVLERSKKDYIYPPCKTEKEARDVIDKYKEQKGIKTSILIPS